MQRDQPIPIQILTDEANEATPKPPIKVGLSACLAGELVRYNGGHTASRLCNEQLSQHFQFETFCPEVAAGFGTPRPTLRLIGDPNQPQLGWTDGEYDDADN